MTPSHDTLLGPAGLGARIAEVEWPKIKADIDSGQPSPLWLVMVPYCGGPNVPCITASLQHGHQILVFAYLLDDANNLTLFVYDCNDPTNNRSTIQLNISRPAHTIQITAAGIEAATADPATIRAFFEPNTLLPTRQF
jgi:hypothetical protein